MTTIAAKDGVMACDSCWTDCHGLHGTSLTKIIRLKSGALLGEAGDNDSRAVVKLLQCVKRFDDMPSAIEIAECKVDYCALIMFPDGDVAMVMIERDMSVEVAYLAGAWKVNRGCAAVGSGGSVAIGAMKAGKSARESVAIACDSDPNSKLPVHTVALQPVPKSCGNGKRARK